MIGNASYYLRRAARAETVGVGAWQDHVVNYAQYIPPMPGHYWAAAATPSPSAVNATTWSGMLVAPGPSGGGTRIGYRAGEFGPLVGWLQVRLSVQTSLYYQSLPLAPLPPTPGAPIAHGPLQRA
jgi:hypothetical protein